MTISKRDIIFFIIIVIWAILLFLATLQVKHRTQIDDYLMAVFLMYGLFFNGLFTASNAQLSLGWKIMVAITGMFVFLLFYVMIIGFSLFFFYTFREDL